MSKYPYFNMQQLNLDWLLEKIKKGEYLSADSALSLASKNPVQNKILTAIIGKDAVTTTAQTLTGAVNELNAELSKSILRAPVTAITANGSTTNTLRGLTADHVVGNWGLYADAECTTPIPITGAPCNIWIRSAADSWILTISNFTSAIYIRPTFIMRQN